MKGNMNVPPIIFNPEKKSNDRCTDSTHHWVVEHLHCETPFGGEDLLID
jgi:hypothetical protein